MTHLSGLPFDEVHPVFGLLRALFGCSRLPEPAGEPRRIRAFSPYEPTIAQDGLVADEGGWRIDANESRTVRLFDVADPGVEQCILTYRAEIKTEAVQGRAYLEMWCAIPGRGEFFSKGFPQAVSGTTDWSRYEIPFYLKQGHQPDLIKLNLVIEGMGTVWVRNVELLSTPVVS